MTKQEIRKIYLGKRKELTAAEVGLLSRQLLRHFSSLKLPAASTLLSYVPMISHNEFDVSSCEDDLKSRIKPLITALPRISAENNHMDAVEIQTGVKHTVNKYGIAEPEYGRIVQPEEIDLVFVPLIAFDNKGFRVGYGKGYYDRFLARCRKNCISIGFSFFEASPSPEDIHQFDVPLHFCISPLRVYEF
jgi:5-formyltetrahydrofolate cyclo-ligase